MKKKALCIMAAVVPVVCLALYFKPLALSRVIDNESEQIDIIISEFAIENGEPSLNPTTYSDVSGEQKQAVLSLMNTYSYRRTPSTLFSNGTITDPGDRTLTVYAYDESFFVAAVVISSSGRLAVQDKSYSMKNADRLIEQIAEIVGQVG